ncbi:AAA family ATPase [Mucilaginibacter phyllosphaerae]
MFIAVVENRRNNLRGFSMAPDFFLEQNDWNDYSYYTSYALHISGKHTDDKQHKLIGRLKILKEGLEKQKMSLATGNVEELDESFCSLGQSLDYYQRISEIRVDLRDRLLRALRDIVIFPEMGQGFEDEPAYNKSLLRDFGRNNNIFTLGPLFISRDFSELLDLDLKFSFKIPEFNLPVEFDFDSPVYGFNERKLPNRISVIIGRNGAGKSTLLSRISRVAFASSKDRTNPTLKEVGIIKPDRLGFPRIITLSYSAFDSFQTPGIFKREKEIILKEIKNGIGRYMFCGVRDIVKELERILPDLPIDAKGRLLPEAILQDRHDTTILKPIDDLGKEFSNYLEIIKKVNNNEEEPIFDRVIEILREEESLHNIADRAFLEDSSQTNFDFFMPLSTGHKFVFHAITGILALTTPYTLLLFDEPETHLHPPILAVLMKAIRHILNKRNSFMIVATHSPVVLQETLKKHVYVIRREDRQVTLEHPEIQTFGENIGLLTSTAFGLTAEVTDFHYTFDRVIRDLTDELFGNKDLDTVLAEIEALFGGELSMQARSYILSKLYERR